MRPAVPVIPTELLVPSDRELAEARAQLAAAGGSYAAVYALLGVAVSGLAGPLLRALRAGDTAGAAARLRWLAALDLAAAERRGAVTADDRATRPARRSLAGVR